MSRKSPFEAFGVECKSGWKGLYEPLIELCNLKGNTVLQVKEKFGGLRFYFSGPYPMDDIVRAAERESYHTCEICGEHGVESWMPEKVYKVTTSTSETSGWIRSLCTPCRKAWDDSRRKRGN